MSKNPGLNPWDPGLTPHDIEPQTGRFGETVGPDCGFEHILGSQFWDTTVDDTNPALPINQECTNIIPIV